MVGEEYQGLRFNEKGLGGEIDRKTGKVGIG